MPRHFYSHLTLQSSYAIFSFNLKTTPQRLERTTQHPQIQQTYSYPLPSPRMRLRIFVLQFGKGGVGIDGGGHDAFVPQ